eukprot:8630640-Pyramimonas_sp.AAC.2
MASRPLGPAGKCSLSWRWVVGGPGLHSGGGGRGAWGAALAGSDHAPTHAPGKASPGGMNFAGCGPSRGLVLAGGWGFSKPPPGRKPLMISTR